MRCSRTILLSIVLCYTLRPISSQGAPVITPSFAVLFPGSEVIFSCINATSVIVWTINGASMLALPPGASIVNDTALRVNMSANATMYGCADVIATNNFTFSTNNAILVLAAAPANVTNIMIDLNTVNIDDNNLMFTLNWDEPFDNFDPIMNYTITINCNDASCPVMFNVTTTSASVSFITDFSVTPLSVTATNTVGTSNLTTIRIVVPDAVGMVSIMCSPVGEMNQCIVKWNESTINPNITNAVPASTKYNVGVFGDGIDNRTLTVDVPMATIDDLPAEDSDVNVFVTAMNVFGPAEPSDVATDEIMASSVMNLMSSMVPNVTMNTYSIVVTCEIDPGLIIQSCEVTARSDFRTVSGSAPVMNNIASVTLDLMCGETYIITAGGINDSMSVGPQLRQATNVTTGPCPTTTTMITTPTVTSTTTSTTPSIMITVTPAGNSSSTGSNNNTGAIVGGVVGGIIAAIILIIIIIMVVWCCMKHREKSSRPTSPGDKVGFRPASGVKVQTLDRYGKPVPSEQDNTDTGVELTGYTSKSPEFTVTTSTGQPSTFQSNDYQTAPSDEKNRTPSAFLPEGSYDTLAPADEPQAPSAQVIPPAQNGQSNPNAPKLNYAELEQFTRKPASVKKPEAQPSSQYAVIDPKSLQPGTYT